jgi:scyllo-inosose 3-dehydrogenase
MRAFYVEADWAPKEGYRVSDKERSTQRALRGNQIWKDIHGSVTNRPEPEITAPDEVILKVGAAGICGTDAHLLKKDEYGYSLYDGHSKYPIITGHEFSGEVVEVGKGVTSLKTGDLVSVESMNWCGECDACRRGMFNQCRNLEEPGLTYDGGFAEYVKVKAKYCYLLNDIVNFYNDKKTAFELGAMIEPTGVAYNGLFVRGGGIRPGGHVVVFGAGPIGLSAISLMKTAGAAKLIAFETIPERQSLARECGADYVFNPQDFSDAFEQSERLMDLTNGAGISLFVECAGATKFTYPVMAKSLAIGGKTIQISHPIGATPVETFYWQWNAAAVIGSNGQSGSGIYSDVISLMASGRIDMRKMCTGRFNLEDIEQGMKITAGKVLVSPDYGRQ